MNHAIPQGKPEILHRCTENAVTKEQTIVDKQNACVKIYYLSDQMYRDTWSVNIGNIFKCVQ
jgi:hypothetical protein